MFYVLEESSRDKKSRIARAVRKGTVVGEFRLQILLRLVERGHASSNWNRLVEGELRRFMHLR